MDRTDPTTRRSFEGAARNYNSYGGLKHFLPTNSIAQSPTDEKQNAIGRQKMFEPIVFDQ